MLSPALDRLSQDGRERVRTLVTRPFSDRVDRPQLDAGVAQKLRELLRADSRRIQDFVGRAAPGWQV